MVGQINQEMDLLHLMWVYQNACLHGREGMCASLARLPADRTGRLRRKSLDTECPQKFSLTSDGGVQTYTVACHAMEEHTYMRAT